MSCDKPFFRFQKGRCAEALATAAVPLDSQSDVERSKLVFVSLLSMWRVAALSARCFVVKDARLRSCLARETTGRSPALASTLSTREVGRRTVRSR
jgi:hypothetical protein